MGFDECFLLGQIVKTHALQGEVSAWLDVDDPGQYKNLESVFLDQNGKLVPFFISRLSISDKRAIISFDGVATLEDADTLIGADLYLPLSFLPALPEGKYYFHDLIGFDFFDGDKLIGKVSQIYELPTHTLVAVDHEGKEILIPAEEQVLGKVDLKNKKIQANLPSGLVELYLS